MGTELVKQLGDGSGALDFTVNDNDGKLMDLKIQQFKGSCPKATTPGGCPMSVVNDTDYILWSCTDNDGQRLCNDIVGRSGNYSGTMEQFLKNQLVVKEGYPGAVYEKGITHTAPFLGDDITDLRIVPG